MSFPLMPTSGTNYSLPSLQFVTSVTTSANNTTYTFSAVSIGTAASDRFVVATVHGHHASSIVMTSATIGGVAATILAQNYATTIIMAYVPTGTTADVVVTFSGLEGRCSISIYSLTGRSLDYVVDAKTSQFTTAAGSVTIVPTHTDCVVVAASTFESSSAVAWTNATEAFDALAESGTVHSSAYVSTAVNGNLTVTCTGSANLATIVAVAFS